MWETVAVAAVESIHEMEFLKTATPEEKKVYFEQKRQREIQRTEERRHQEILSAIRSRNYNSGGRANGGSSDMLLGGLIGYGIGSLFD